MEHITVHNKRFKKFIDASQIHNRVKELAAEIKPHYQDKHPVFVILLNGAFMFAADLLREWEQSADTRFIKVSSYEDMESTGKIEFNREAILDLKGRDVIIVEDIIDTGQTLYEFTHYLKSIGVSSLRIACLLLKPDKLIRDVSADYLGFSIPDLFVIGYGLDFNNSARNLNGLYILDEDVPAG